jgi:hypothetical protein
MNTDREISEEIADVTMTILSDCRQYRYTLARKLPGAEAPLVFCMLNPSTADENSDDPTIRRCMGFAQREGRSGILVVNLFALRATDPRVLLHHSDPVGPMNDRFLRLAASRHGEIICAWGAVPQGHNHRAQRAAAILREHGATLLCLGKTKHGAPRHPLYLKSDTPIIPFNGD